MSIRFPIMPGIGAGSHSPRRAVVLLCEAQDGPVVLLGLTDRPRICGQKAPGCRSAGCPPRFAFGLGTLVKSPSLPVQVKDIGIGSGSWSFTLSTNPEAHTLSGTGIGHPVSWFRASGRPLKSGSRRDPSTSVPFQFAARVTDWSVVVQSRSPHIVRADRGDRRMRTGTRRTASAMEPPSTWSRSSARKAARWSRTVLVVIPAGGPHVVGPGAADRFEHVRVPGLTGGGIRARHDRPSGTVPVFDQRQPAGVAPAPPLKLVPTAQASSGARSSTPWKTACWPDGCGAKT